MVISNKKIITILCIPVLILGYVKIHAQQINYAIEKAPFSSSSADDFSPVYYKDGIVYCSNALNPSLMSIKSSGENLFNILYAVQKDSGSWKTPTLLSEKLSTIFNEGPATFTPEGDTIYFIRNNEIKGKLKDINDPSNTLGIFSAERINENWSNTTPFPYNSKAYSMGTPSLSADGFVLYFASDMPGGFGGTDIYYCLFENGQWTKPKNLGKSVNTKYNEAYPFAGSPGKLYFSSDKPGGYGGKDIYFSTKENGKWSSPILLKKDINSGYDDYGTITDINMEHGYFSSNRKGLANIYSFKTIIPQFEQCKQQEPFSACFNFYDEQFSDTLHLEYEWDFGHGNRHKGYKVKHCFGHPGKYSAVLTIIHKLADSVFETKSTYYFEVDRPKGPFILTNQPAYTGQKIKLYNTHLADNGAKFYWNINGKIQTSANEIETIFHTPGLKEVSLGILYPKDSSGFATKSCITSLLKIFSDEQEMATESHPLIVPNKPSLSKMTEKQKKESHQFFIHPYIAADLVAETADSLASALRFISNYRLEFSEDGIPSNESESILDFLYEQTSNIDNIQLYIAVHEDKKGSEKQNFEKTSLISGTILQYYQLKHSQPQNISCHAFGSERNINAKNKGLTDQNKRIEIIFMNK